MPEAGSRRAGRTEPLPDEHVGNHDTRLRLLTLNQPTLDQGFEGSFCGGVGTWAMVPAEVLR
jgi:hypothetical protein